MKKKALVLVMTGMLAAASLTGCGSLNESDVVVTVGKEEITADIANFYARYTQAQYETYYGAYLGEDMWSSEASEGETYEESVKNSVLESLEKMVLFEQHMKDYEVSLTDAEKEVIHKAAADFAEDNALENKEKVSGDEKTVERVLTLMAIQTKVQPAIEAGVDAEVSDEEAAQKSMQYVLLPYTTTDEEGKSVDLSDDEKATVKEKAETLAKSAKEGGDFAQLAADAEVEVQTATFDKETTVPDENLIKTADKLAENEVTDVVETKAGCYVGKVTSLLDREATDKKKEVIVSERKTELVEKTLEGWKKDSKVKVNKRIWKKIDFNDLKVTMKQKTEVPYADEVKTDDQVDTE